ncbi:MAG TPA: glycosyltransferase family 2 protein [Nocardioidaceae bacterium]
MTTTVLLVSHDGARWLPAVLDGLARQTRRPDRVVAVDTGSADAGPALLRDRLGDDAVVTAPRTATFATAVRTGLDALPPATGDEPDWIWLLHDDSAPAPDALERLLDAARDNPSASILGPKLREWPSLRRLLEIGVTISGTGRRETGLERGEYDQGQHDRMRDVLAVNTAGMLVRREVLQALGGFDERLPVFGNDIDFGWRAARAGHRTLVVPDAVLFHVEAAHRGLRRTRVTTRAFRRAERRAALYTLLVNGSLLSLPFRLVRLFLGSLLRATGFLLVRAPGEAWDEIAALARTYARPDLVLAGRLRRRRTAKVPHRQVRHLLAPPWLPYRHGLDFVTDVASALGHQMGEASAARARRGSTTETGPVDSEMESLPADTGVLARMLSSPVALLFAALVLAALFGARGLLGPGLLSGGALLPAPDSAMDWWRLYLASWHDVGIGSDAPTAPYVLPLAMAATVLFGKAWLVVDLLFLFVVPLAAFGGYRFLRAIGVVRLPALWAATAYGLLPVLGGAVGEGRLGTVAAAVLLPWVAHAALGLGPGTPADRRWQAAWRTALGLALLTAFTPVAWLMAVVLAVVVLAWALLTGDRAVRRPSMWSPAAVALLATPVLLLPWSLTTFLHLGPASWLFEAGLPAPDLTSGVTSWDVLLGRPGDLGSAPAWISVGVPLAALAALTRPDTRERVLRPWVVLVVALALTGLAAAWTFQLPTTTAPQPLWLGLPLLVVQAAALCAAAQAGTGVSAQLSGSSFGWRQPIGLVVTVVAVLSPLAGLAWWVVSGVEGPIDRKPATRIPAYMVDAARADANHGTLVVTREDSGAVRYVLLREAGRRLGEDSVAPSVAQQRRLTDLVGHLVTAPTAEDVDALGRHGAQYVYSPPPADLRLTANLDSVSGLTSAGVIEPGARAWQLAAKADGRALPRPDASARPWLLALQGLAIVVAAVLAAPGRRRTR